MQLDGPGKGRLSSSCEARELEEWSVLLLLLGLLASFVLARLVLHRYSLSPTLIARLLYGVSVFNVILMFAMFEAGPRSAVGFGEGEGDLVFLRGLWSLAKIQTPYVYMLAGSTLLVFVLATLIPRVREKTPC